MATAIGAIITAILVVNNLRDIEQDRAVGKRTVAVRIGARATRLEYCALMVLPYVLITFGAVLACCRRRRCSPGCRCPWRCGPHGAWSRGAAGR